VQALRSRAVRRQLVLLVGLVLFAIAAGMAISMMVTPYPVGDIRPVIAVVIAALGRADARTITP
jgi:hypothetical protein